MARMLGRVRGPWCRSCCAPPGPDCPHTRRDTRQQRYAERRQAADEVDDEINGWRDGLYAVVQPTWAAGFVIEDGEVTMCAPILRRRLGYWRTIARRVVE